MPTLRTTLSCTLVFLAIVYEVQSQGIEGPCINTGPTCINSCKNETGSNLADGNYQWCEGCQWFVACSSGFLQLSPCPGNLVWNGFYSACLSQSPTCYECIIYKPSTTGNPITTTPLPIDRVCSSTGPICVESCPNTQNGNFQWCGRCDYFLACSGGQEHFMPCQTGLVYDHNLQRCEFQSGTCTCLANTLPPSTCSGLPCLNGDCSEDGTDGYICTCWPGWTGRHCETNIDECESEPCLNGATCLDGIDLYICECPEWFTGTHCETPIYRCDENPCREGSTCRELPPGGYLCECAPGWTGEDCRTDIDECASNPCQHGGTCTDLENGYTCTCIPGYTGSNCETDIDECQSTPCLNGGTCTDHLNGYTCECVPGFTGTRCETSEYNFSNDRRSQLFL